MTAVLEYHNANLDHSDDSNRTVKIVMFTIVEAKFPDLKHKINSVTKL